MTEVKIPDAGGDTLTMLDMGGFIHPNFLKTESEARRIFENVPNFEFSDDDLMLCTFGKTGTKTCVGNIYQINGYRVAMHIPRDGTSTNWMFEILMMILRRSAERVKENKAMTMIELVSAEEADRQPSPRVVSSHFPPRYLPISGMRAKQIKTILCVRNPKDTAVSYYNHMKGFNTYEYTGKWENWLPVFLQGKLEYEKYADYLKEWQRLITDGQGFPLHIIYYEDLKLDGIEELNKLLKFLDIELDEKLKKDIIEMCSFQKMAEEKGRHEIFKAYSNGDFNFFRKGQVGDWKNWFTVAQNEMFDEIWERDAIDADMFKFKYA